MATLTAKVREMRVVVTGGTGFTGKALVKRLIEQGHEVVALDHQEGLRTEEIKQWGGEVIIGSITDRSVVERALKGAEVVQHLAAAFRELGVPDSYYEEVNVGGTRIVLDVALKQGVKKIIYCSTCGVHGNVEHPPATEDSPIRAADYYQKSKYLAEPIVQEYSERGLNTVILRPTALYGPGDKERFGMIFKRVDKGMFPIFGDGKALYHPVYVENYVDASVLVQAPGVGDGETYLIADEKYLTIEELVLKIARAMNKQNNLKLPHYPLLPLRISGHLTEWACKPFGIAPPIFPRRVDWYRQNRAFDIGKAKREINYVPKIGLDEGLRRTYEWFLQENYLS
jgi:nucleoside-diphosphate-sugar epimerase